MAATQCDVLAIPIGAACSSIPGVSAGRSKPARSTSRDCRTSTAVPLDDPLCCVVSHPNGVGGTRVAGNRENKECCARRRARVTVAVVSNVSIIRGHPIWSGIWVALFLARPHQLGCVPVAGRRGLRGDVLRRGLGGPPNAGGSGDGVDTRRCPLGPFTAVVPGDGEGQRKTSLRSSCTPQWECAFRRSSRPAPRGVGLQGERPGQRRSDP
jgi:hypothetical protein